MNKFKFKIAKWAMAQISKGSNEIRPISDAKGSPGGRELAVAKRITYKSGNGTDFEDPDYSFSDIQTGYNTDAYIRQGVDKYVDQIFKEGYTFYGNNVQIVEYLKNRFAYMAEATGIPTDELFIEIAEDFVKFGNTMIVKARGNDPNTLPQGAALRGMYSGDPVVGYFIVDPETMKCKRDEFGTIQEWRQESDSGQTTTFKPEDVIHFYYKKPRGAAYGTSFLVPVLDDVRALRQAEENVLKMMYRNIYPFMHAKVGSVESPGSQDEVDAIQASIEGMDLEGGIATSERVEIKAIASDKVIDAHPYLQYMEQRVFSGMGIPGILFGRGDTSNRSTGDNMTSEMADRIRAICRTLEVFINQFMVKEILMEGGYDPLLQPDNLVQFKFNDNDVDVRIKKEVHAIFKYEHNSITEDEMRSEIGLDPIPDGEREKLFVNIITRETLAYQASLSGGQTGSGTENKKSDKKNENGSKETNNKQKNGGGKPAGKNKDYDESVAVGIIKDYLDNLKDDIDKYVNDCYKNKQEIVQGKIWKRVVDCNKDIIYTIRNKGLSDELDNVVSLNATILLNQINDTLIGQNTYSVAKETLCDLLGNHISIYTDNLLNKISHLKDDRKDTAA